jgi:predicted histone-like DNA-binding protein
MRTQPAGASNPEIIIIFINQLILFVMPLFYKKVQRGNPANPSAPKLWYPILKSVGLVREKQVAKLLADETTLNPKEAEMTLFQLLKVIVNLLLEGHTVQLGELGSFHLTARSEGSEKESEVNPGKIKKIVLHFTSSAELRERISKATFKDAASMQ